MFCQILCKHVPIHVRVQGWAFNYEFVLPHLHSIYPQPTFAYA